jgi:polyhydroxybutyrate depolymerase
MIYRFSLIFILGFVLVACGGRANRQAPTTQATLNPGRPQPGDYPITLKVGALERAYIAHIPPAYNNQTPVPVVLMFHGGGGTAQAAIEETGWTKKSDAARFLVVFPEGTRPDPSKPARFIGNPQTWNDGSGRFDAGEQNVDDVGFVNALIDDVIARFVVDQRRIFATGFSNGASMTYRLGVELSNRIAAIAPISPSGLRLQDPLALSKPVSLLSIHGAADPLNPIEGGMVTIGGKPDPRPPVRDSVERWAKMLNCPSEPRSLRDQDGVHAIAYAPCAENSEAIFYVIDSMGHTWPGGKSLLPEILVGKTTNKINASQVIWDFFAAHALK